MIRVLLLVILILLIARAFWRVIDGVIEAAGGGASRKRVVKPQVKLVRDPVCGTWVPPRPALSLTAGETTHYFCSEECRARFGR